MLNILSYIPRFFFLFLCNIHCSMHNSKNKNLILCNLLYKLVFMEKYFSNICHIELRHNSSDFRELSDLLSSRYQLVDKNSRIERSPLCYI